MKEIKALVQPFLLDKVIDSLHQVRHLPGLTVSTVQGFQRSDPAGTRPNLDTEAAMAKIEVVVPDALVETVVDTIVQAARTGRPGDGKVFVIEVAGAVKIRNGQSGEEAL